LLAEKGPLGYVQHWDRLHQDEGFAEQECPRYCKLCGQAFWAYKVMEHVLSCSDCLSLVANLGDSDQGGPVQTVGFHPDDDATPVDEQFTHQAPYQEYDVAVRHGISKANAFPPNSEQAADKGASFGSSAHIQILISALLKIASCGGLESELPNSSTTRPLSPIPLMWYGD
jgi:hypothetical protein